MDMRRNRYHHLGWLHGIELYDAAFSNQVFARHAHEGFAVGAIVEGAGGYHCRGERMVLPAGSLSLMNPEEAHTDHAAASRVRYHMLYVSEAAVRTILDLPALRGFEEVTPVDRDLVVSRALTRLSDCLSRTGSPDERLAAEEATHEVLTVAFERHGRATLRRARREPAAIHSALEVIAERVAEGAEVSLADLAMHVDLNPSYLVRSMVRATGLTPHELVLRHRVNCAREMLLMGVPAAEAAVVAGFCDQSHKIRHVRRQLGVTPGAIVRH